MDKSNSLDLTMFPEDGLVVLFDGICNLCNTSIQFLIKYERFNIFYFAALESNTAKLFFEKNIGKIEIPDSIVVIYNKKVAFKSDAILLISKYLKSPFQVVSLGKFVPKFFRDLLYDQIAKSRYSIFGKRDFCMIPNDTISKKFLY